MKKFGPLDIVCVEWRDAASSDGWSYDVDELILVMSEKRYFSIGVLLEKTKEYVAIARDFAGLFSNDDGSFCTDSHGGVMRIPIGCIVKVTDIKSTSIVSVDGKGGHK